jgi:hypothetical protein
MLPGAPGLDFETWESTNSMMRNNPVRDMVAWSRFAAILKKQLPDLCQHHRQKALDPRRRRNLPAGLSFLHLLKEG